MTWNRKALRRRVGGSGYLNDMVISTATGGSSSTVVDSSLTQSDNFFDRGSLFIATGAAAGDERNITSWLTNTFTVTRNFTAAIVAGVEYEAHRIFTPTDVHNAINVAILLAKQRWPRIVVDTSLVQDVDVYQHNITALSVPVDRELGIDELRYEAAGLLTGEEWPLVPRNEYYLVEDGANLYLQLRVGAMYDGLKWKLVYRTNPPQLTSDTSVLVPDDSSLADFVCAMATSLLCGDRSLMEREDTVKGPWIVRAADYRETANRLLVQDRKHKRPGKVKLVDNLEVDEETWRLSAPADRMRVS